MDERRKHDRAEIDEIAYIFGDGSSVRCRVLNISEEGAAIELADPRSTRPQFKLMIQNNRAIKNCCLVWSSGSRIGVKFVD
ncbi:PilZ domain-containing protein [Bradyrhizobium sp. WSM471]|uniref:PilZ domain-containing protein n=1 Tax=Bradyrhizobium sp. WSM471 TaxID=319017 RepID=UPI00024D2256|nr:MULTISPECIES: PilZ domain-containing protein [Bradyrhizobium]EHR01384.1 PilZ domain-containing protein [Bradyrhizobium sp. WSM471]UFW43448.1 PilZ domain-containing protein [Bradyrhizobium canariense]